MIKSQLIPRIAGQNTHLFQRDVEKIIDAVLDEIVAALARSDRVELRGFGSFSVKVREGRVGRNPKTGLQSMYLKRRCLSLGRAARCAYVSTPPFRCLYHKKGLVGQRLSLLRHALGRRVRRQRDPGVA